MIADLPLPDLLTLCANRMREAARHDSPEMPGKILEANAEYMDLWAREIKRRMRTMRTGAEMRLSAVKKQIEDLVRIMGYVQNTLEDTSNNNDLLFDYATELSIMKERLKEMAEEME